MNIPQALADGTSQFHAAGIESPGLDAALLLADILGLDRSRLYLADGPLPDSVQAAYTRALDRRMAGEPLAYILGRREFWGLDFAVGPGVLIPRPDTETLVEAVLLGAAWEDGGPLLDLCTGSGAVVIALKHECPGPELWATDISPAALRLARSNVARLLPGQFINFLEADLFSPRSPAPFLGVFSIITANPPYVPSEDISGLAPELGWEPRLALDGGRDGLDLIRRIVAEAPAHLVPGGALFMEADPRQMETIAGLLASGGFIGIQLYQDLPGKDRVITGSLPKTAKTRRKACV
jgi:release factor glutamine methyltransferase